MIKKYTGGCLSLELVLRYLEKKSEAQSYEYESEQIKIDHHLTTCEDCQKRIQIFIERYGPGDDPAGMVF